MDAVMRFSYAVGRAIGKGLGEFLVTMWPDPPSSRRALSADDMTPDPEESEPEDWSDWAPPIIAEALGDVQHAVILASIVSDKLAADPARAITALWDYQLRQDTT